MRHLFRLREFGELPRWLIQLAGWLIQLGQTRISGSSQHGTSATKQAHTIRNVVNSQMRLWHPSAVVAFDRNKPKI